MLRCHRDVARHSLTQPVQYYLRQLTHHHILVHALFAEIISYIRYVQSMYAMHYHNRLMLGTALGKLPCLLSLTQDTAQNLNLAARNYLARTVYLTHITEKSGLQGSVAAHYLAHCLKSARHILLQLIRSAYVAILYICEFTHQSIRFLLHHRIEDIALILKICIDGAPPLFGGRGYIIHSGVLDTLTGKELTGHFYESVTGFQYHTCTDS